MTKNIESAVAALIDACMAERGCSRLIAAAHAAEACVVVYNRIQLDTGSTARSQIVDCAWLHNLLEEHAMHVPDTEPQPNEDMDRG